MVSSLIESCQKHSIIPVPPKKKMTLIRIVTRFSSSYAMVRTLKSVFSAIFPAQCGAPPPAPAQGDKNLISWLAGCRVTRPTNLREVSQCLGPSSCTLNKDLGLYHRGSGHCQTSRRSVARCSLVRAGCWVWPVQSN